MYVLNSIIQNQISDYVSKSVCEAFENVYNKYPFLKTLNVTIHVADDAELPKDHIASMEMIADSFLLQLNKYWWSKFSLLEYKLHQAINNNWLTAGDNTTKTFIYHEIGHMIKFWLDNQKYWMHNKIINDMFNNNYNYIKYDLSEYASTNKEECFAEMFVKCFTNPNNRFFFKFNKMLETHLKEPLFVQDLR